MKWLLRLTLHFLLCSFLLFSLSVCSIWCFFRKGHDIWQTTFSKGGAGWCFRKYGCRNNAGGPNQSLKFCRVPCKNSTISSTNCSWKYQSEKAAVDLAKTVHCNCYPLEWKNTVGSAFFLISSHFSQLFIVILIFSCQWVLTGKAALFTRHLCLSCYL